MITVLLGLLLLITTAWAVHDSGTTVERHKQYKHCDDSHSVPASGALHPQL